MELPEVIIGISKMNVECTKKVEMNIAWIEITNTY